MPLFFQGQFLCPFLSGNVLEYTYALSLFTPESKHLSMISFFSSVSLVAFLLFATRLWVLPLNSKAKSCCLCSEICFGTFFAEYSLTLFSAIFMAELLESRSARMLFRFSDFCFSSFLEVQFFDPLCLLRFPLSRDFFPQSRTFLFLFYFFHCPLRNRGILFWHFWTQFWNIFSLDNVKSSQFLSAFKGCCREFSLDYHCYRFFPVLFLCFLS